MVLSRFFRIEAKGVHQAALLLASTSVANGLLALFRDRLLAGTYGASRALDIYYAAFRVPDIIFSISLFFVASTAFIPLFLEHKHKSKEESKQFLDSVFTLFVFTATACVVGTYVALPYLMKYIVPGFDIAARQETLMLSRIMLLSPLLLGASSLVSGVIQTSRRFLVYAMSPIMYNAGIIIGVIYFVPSFGSVGLAYGVVFGALLHFAIQVPTLIQLESFPRFRLSWNVRPFDIFYFSFPRAFALSVNQMTLFALTSFASTLGVGAIAVFTLSSNLYALAPTIIGLSYSIAAFPLMAELALKEDKSIFFEHLLVSLRHIIFWTLPVTGLFIVLRAHIVRIILGTGAFAWIDTRLTIASLLLFSFAIVVESLVTLFVRAFYALGKTREPVVYNIISAVVMIVTAVSSVWVLRTYPAFALSVTHLFRLDGVGQIEFLSLPFAFSFGGIINAVLLGASILKYNGALVDLKEAKRSVKLIATISAVMALCAYAALRVLAVFVESGSVLSFVLQGAAACAIALGVGAWLCVVFRVREFAEIREALRERGIKRDILQPEVEHM